MKLLKFLATAGEASRREAERMIRGGRVTINGIEIREPAVELVEGVVVAVDGKPVRVEAKRYLLLHKPKGVISTAKDPHGRKTVLDLVDASERLYPVGRLDSDSSGLLLLTNDGELANRLLHPRYESEKTYQVMTTGPVSGKDLQRLERGVELDDGPTAPAKARRLDERRFELTIHEGRNRQVRRMVAAVGNDVKALVRVSTGPLSLGDLPPGKSRELSEAEVSALRTHAKL